MGGQQFVQWVPRSKGQSSLSLVDTRLRDVALPLLRPTADTVATVVATSAQTSDKTSPHIRRYASSVRTWGVAVVRNEVDIVRTNVLYHLSLGLERMLIADNGSTDGTREALAALAVDRRVEWRDASGPFDQGDHRHRTGPRGISARGHLDSADRRRRVLVPSLDDATRLAWELALYGAR